MTPCDPCELHMLCGEAAWSIARSRCKGPKAECLAGWVAASQLGFLFTLGSVELRLMKSCLPGGEDRRPGWLEAEAWHTGTYLDVNIFSGESSWEMRPHRERLCGSLESGPDGFLPSCTTILRRL